MISMSSATLRLVLLVSCAHALVHVFELALPSVEQMIAADFGVGREQTGALGTVWRLPFGLGALLAGWLADRYGSKPMLLVFLVGCIATSVAAWRASTLEGVFGAMFAMGCFASIYHPAGLALISRETTAANRPAALGWHGIVGSLGIAGAPLIAGVVFSAGALDWGQYYLLLCVPAGVVALLIAGTLHEHRPPADTSPPLSPGEVDSLADAESESEPDQRAAFFLLVTVGALSGFIYAAFMHFLPRYLDGVSLRPSGTSAAGLRNMLAAGVLGFAILGQALAGRLARPGRLESQLTTVILAGAPCLLWMAVADGPWRVVAACLLAMVHFMHQPLYNSLIAQYVPPARRSVGYGFSNMVSFGFGALGPTFAGLTASDVQTYGGLAVVAMLAGTLSLRLARGRRNQSGDKAPVERS
jgi:MFS family permease